MTLVIGALILVGLCMFGRSLLIAIAIGFGFWALCAALAGAVAGALAGGHVGAGAAIGVGCYAWWLVSTAANERRAATAAAANLDALMHYQAQLNAEAMADVAVARRLRPGCGCN
jgi:hypothetical protein